MTIDTFDGLTPIHAIEDDPGVLVGIDCPQGDSNRAVMVGSFLGTAHFTCAAGGHVWVEDSPPTGTCDTSVGGGLRCGRTWGHDGFCAIDGGYVLADIPIAIMVAVLAGLVPNVLVAAVVAGGLVGWLVWGRSWVRS